MRASVLIAALTVAACGSSASQTGQIADCSGITLSGPGAFVPLSGFAFQNVANLGGGATGSGPWEVVIWAGSGDAGTPTQSQQANCSQLLAGAFSTSLFIPPQTLEFNLSDSTPAGSYSRPIDDYTQPRSESAVVLEDLLGTINISSLGTECLSGTFTANLAPVDPVSDTPIDGGVVLPVSGTFGVPVCH
jgi:hypothetical protein